MPKFFFEGVDTRGRRVQGAEDAKDQTALLVALQAKGIFVTRWKEGAERTRRLLGERRRGLNFSLRREFIMELGHLIRSGVPVDRSLRILADSTRSAALRQAVLDIREAVRSGLSLSEAVARRAPECGELVVNMIRVGEVGGVLDEVLEKLGAFMTRSEETRKFILTSSLYPALLLFMGVASVAAILGFVIPKFAVIFDELGPKVPWATAWLIGVSEAFRRFWWLGGLLIALGVWGVWAFARNPKNRALLDRQLLKAPLVGPLVSGVELGRLARTLGTLLVSGVPLLKSLAIVQGVVRNSVIRQALAVIYQKVQQGKPLSALMRESDVFPARVVHMTAIGEETGHLGEMLLSVADDVDRDVQTRTRAALALLEPVIIVFMGVLIGGMVISMLLAVMGLQEVSF
uniref:Type II secretion system F family protein n=1 Tax=Desulfacinum infernum TaxID=35837 RepID=A0A832A2A4_9BACT